MQTQTRRTRTQGRDPRTASAQANAAFVASVSSLNREPWTEATLAVVVGFGLPYDLCVDRGGSVEIIVGRGMKITKTLARRVVAVQQQGRIVFYRDDVPVPQQQVVTAIQL